MKKSQISTAVALLFIIYIYSLVDFNLLISALHTHLYELFMYAFLILVPSYLRMGRNYALLHHAGMLQTSLLRFLPIGLVGNSISTYGPFKSGELIVAQLYDATFDCKIYNTLAVIIVGRTLDITIVLLFASSTIFLLNIQQTYIFLLIIFLIAIAVIIALFILLNQRAGIFLLKQLRHLHFLNKIQIKLESFVNEYYKSLQRIITDQQAKLILISYTLGRWILEILLAIYFYHIFGINLTLLQIIPLLGIAYVIGVSSGAPGGLGTSQFTVLALLVYSFHISVSQASLAIAVGLTVFTIIQLLQISIGFLASKIISL